MDYKSFVDAVKSRTSISALVGRYTPVSRRGSRVMALCPFHKEKSPSFFIFEAEGHYHCFGCGAHGDVIDFMMAQKGCDFGGALEQLAAEAGMSMDQLDQRGSPEEARRQTLLYQIMEKAALFYREQLQANVGMRARQYLVKRQVNTDMQQKYMLGYAPGGTALRDFLLKQGYAEQQLRDLSLLNSRGKDFFRDRLLFPIFNKTGKVIAFGGRTLTDEMPKYLNSGDTAIFHKSQNLYGFYQSRQASAKKAPLVICEGYLDVICLAQNGYEKAVAPLGTALTEEQILLAWKLESEPIICFDGDSAGHRAAQHAALKALPILEAGRSLRFITLPATEDPASLLETQGAGAFQQVLEKPLPLITYLWQLHQSEYASDTPEHRALSKQKLTEKINSIKNPEIRNNYYRMLMDAFFKATSPGSRPKNPANSSVDRPAARLLVDGQQIREQILLALPLAHPQILDEIQEELGSFLFHKEALNALKNELISYISEGYSLEKNALHTHLSLKGYKNILDALSSKSLWIHEKCIRSDASTAEAKSRWVAHYQEFYDRLAQDEAVSHTYDRIRAQLFGT